MYLLKGEAADESEKNNIRSNTEMIASDEDMISQHISAVLRLALNTFRSNPQTFVNNIGKLVHLFNKTTSQHVNLHPMFMNEATWKIPNKAPMSYISIFNNEIVNMGIFILKPNMKLPLHNHPNMYGLLKVIAGQVKVKSYTIKSQKNIQTDMEERLFIVAERNDDVIVNESSECCVLDPLLGNVHEIETSGSPAAFVDILSPPYETEDQSRDKRKCSYFRVIRESQPRIFELEEINTPSWFWSDTYPYTGPEPNVEAEEIKTYV